jgi:hypothetical protein
MEKAAAHELVSRGETRRSETLRNRRRPTHQASLNRTYRGTSMPPAEPVTLTLVVEQPEPTPGTAEWLIQKAKKVVLCPRGSRGRQAILADAEGKPLMRLCLVHKSKGGENREYLVSPESVYRDCPYALTDAAWELVYKVRDHAMTLLREPTWMVSAVKVTFRPSLEDAEHLRKASAEDHAARAALYDRLLESEMLHDRVTALPPPWQRDTPEVEAVLGEPLDDGPLSIPF